MAPAPGLPGKLYFNIYQNQNDYAKPPSMGCTLPICCIYEITKKEHSKQRLLKKKKKEKLPLFP